MEILEELVELAGHLAWPVVLLIIIFTIKGELKSTFKALAKRISDPDSSISIGKKGLEIKTSIEAAFGRIESLEVIQKQSSQKLFAVSENQEVNSHINDSTDLKINSDLMKLAEEYLEVSISDWSERVRTKDNIAMQMANIVLTENISKQLLADQDHEGLIMALVSAIHINPSKGDFIHVSKCAPNISRLHIKYRTTMALGRLFEQNYASNDDVKRAYEILRRFEEKADSYLLKRIEQTRAIITLAIQRA